MIFSKLARAGAFSLVFVSSIAAAQQPVPVRGAIESLDGSMLVVKPSEGPDVSIKLTDNAQVFGVKPATIADVKVGDFIGVGAMPQPDGSQKAILVTIFADSLRGLGEGFRPWDRPGTTMTNATVDSMVAGVDGQELLLKYKDGEKKIIIGPDAKIRAYVAGDRSELQPGAHIAVMRPDKLADGSLQAGRINVGRDGLVP
jgi:hypothetical protein